MAAVLLDTTVLIDVLRGRSAADRLRRMRSAGYTPHVCAVNVEEVARGLRATEASGARMLFAGVGMVPLTEAEGWRAGEWRREYAARGQTLSQADCLVAAAAFAVGGRLVTGNPRHFPMPEVDVEHWPAAE
ncbi:MAG: PIN domain-containing protein [Actinobacteria bacterium]|nr:PIN domain-containing protein [Actinomycetota bacterium]